MALQYGRRGLHKQSTVGWAEKGVLSIGHAGSRHFSGISIVQRIREEGEAGMQLDQGCSE